MVLMSYEQAVSQISLQLIPLAPATRFIAAEIVRNLEEHS